VVSDHVYLETVDSAISNPSFNNSPWMRGGAPQWVLLAQSPDKIPQLKADSGSP
jgi:hypothetical protein